MPAFRMQGAEGVGIAQIFDPPQRRLGLRLEQGVLQPGLGPGGVLVFGNDVVVAHQHHGLFVLEQALGVQPQPFQPGQLVVELGAGPMGLPLGA